LCYSNIGVYLKKSAEKYNTEKYVQILAAFKNQADGKIFVVAENQADGKILAGVAISVPSEILAELEKQAARLLFRLGRISNC
jgi:hypothetical protein